MNTPRENIVATSPINTNETIEEAPLSETGESVAKE